MLTGATGAAILAVIAKLLPIALAAIADLIVKQQAASQARADDVALGQATMTSAVNKETADAQRRAADATTNAPGVGAMLDDMSGGKF